MKYVESKVLTGGKCNLDELIESCEGMVIGDECVIMNNMGEGIDRVKIKESK